MRIRKPLTDGHSQIPTKWGLPNTNFTCGPGIADCPTHLPCCSSNGVCTLSESCDSNFLFDFSFPKLILFQNESCEIDKAISMRILG